MLQLLHSSFVAHGLPVFFGKEHYCTDYFIAVILLCMFECVCEHISSSLASVPQTVAFHVLFYGGLTLGINQ
jgi:hypothetical protein